MVCYFLTMEQAEHALDRLLAVLKAAEPDPVALALAASEVHEVGHCAAVARSSTDARRRLGRCAPQRTSHSALDWPCSCAPPIAPLTFRPCSKLGRLGSLLAALEAGPLRPAGGSADGPPPSAAVPGLACQAVVALTSSLQLLPAVWDSMLPQDASRLAAASSLLLGSGRRLLAVPEWRCWLGTPGAAAPSPTPEGEAALLRHELHCAESLCRLALGDHFGYVQVDGIFEPAAAAAWFEAVADAAFRLAPVDSPGCRALLAELRVAASKAHSSRYVRTAQELSALWETLLAPTHFVLTAAPGGGSSSLHAAEHLPELLEAAAAAARHLPALLELFARWQQEGERPTAFLPSGQLSSSSLPGQCSTLWISALQLAAHVARGVGSSRPLPHPAAAQHAALRAHAASCRLLLWAASAAGQRQLSILPAPGDWVPLLDAAAAAALTLVEVLRPVAMPAAAEQEPASALPSTWVHL
ncbi:hypothetical protein ABPG75_000908 [Micractinium tetrahymenae]